MPWVKNAKGQLAYQKPKEKRGDSQVLTDRDAVRRAAAEAERGAGADVQPAFPTGPLFRPVPTDVGRDGDAEQAAAPGPGAGAGAEDERTGAGDAPRLRTAGDGLGKLRPGERYIRAAFVPGDE